MDWRERVIRAAEKWWMRNIQDGTGEGNRIIGTDLLKAAGVKPRPDYQNGSLSWCGYTAQAVYMEAGFIAGASLASAGKCVYGFGLGNKMFSGAKAFASYEDNFQDDRRVHQRYAEAAPGDLLVRLNKPGEFNGHVTIVHKVLPDKGEILTIEGNGMGTLPTGLYAEGLVKTTRMIEHLEMCRRLRPYYIVVPSDKDFKDVPMVDLPPKVSILDKIMSPLQQIQDPNIAFFSIRRRRNG